MSNPESARDLEWDVADRLRKALRYAGVSVAVMAAHLEVHRKTVGNYLSGRTPPSTATLRTWALRCGVPFAWLRYGSLSDEGNGPEGGVTQPFSERRCTVLRPRPGTVVSLIRAA